MNLNPQAQKILEILQDGRKHCPIDWKYADGHGKRLTDINRYLQQFGKTLAWDWCDCGRHTTKIKMRWIIEQNPLNSAKRYQGSTPLPQNSVAGQIERDNMGQNLHPIFQKALFPYQPKYH